MGPIALGWSYGRSVGSVWLGWDLYDYIRAYSVILGPIGLGWGL